jgi:hypothetical protein
LVHTLRREPNAELDAFFRRDNVDVFDLVGTMDDPFGQAEADREVFQVGRGREHDRVRGASVGKGDGCLFR